jgi:hypothetical protein
MRAALKVIGLAGLVLILAACGGSGGSGAANQALTDAKCTGSSCVPEEPAAATPVPTAAPAPLVCGGLTAAKCPQGYHCVDDPADNCDPATGLDCSGICVLGEELPSCGGLAGASCPAGYVCTDDPADACSGGPAVDCPGVCRPQAEGQCTADADCPQLKAPCSVCADGTVSCPLSHCDNGQCIMDFKPCSEPPEPATCGGIAGLSCAPGFQCVDDPSDDCVLEKGGADCGGICVPQETPLRCGGILGEQCPAGFECVDDPSDTCDPNSGGADCPGLCKPANTGECKTDADCVAPALCNICADGTESCARSLCDDGLCRVDFPACSTPLVCRDGCKADEVCVADPNDPCDPATGECPGICVTNGTPRPCGGLVGSTCPPGYACVDDPSDDCKPDSSGADCPGVCAPAVPPQCSADADCVQILAPCALCPDGSYACPRSECQNGLCVMVTDACTGPGFCGGIAGFPCPPGSTCVDDPNDDCDPTRGGADCGGICVREEKPLTCGGFSGKTCPDGYACVDDASDDCDPAGGGADCPGICQPAPGKGCSSDADCPQIGAPCRLCADGTAACPRSLCINGQCGAEFEACRGESQPRSKILRSTLQS